MMEVIRARGLTQKFGDNTAVNSLTLTVNEGEVFGLVGPDGAGKVVECECGMWKKHRHRLRWVKEVFDPQPFSLF